MDNLIDPSRLRTIPNYAADYNGGKGVTRGYIYKLIKQGKVETTKIDGVQFVVLPEPPAAVLPSAGE